MRVLLKNTITKKVMIVLITIVMISNFVMPNYALNQQEKSLFLAYST